MYFFVILGRYVKNDERMNPIDFGGQRSKVNVIMDIYGNKLVNTKETKSIVYFFIKHGKYVNHGKRMDPIVFEVRGQRSRSKWTFMEISL